MPASRKWILLINALLVVAVYIFAGAMYSGNGIIIAFFSSILQSAANFVLAMIFLIIRAFQPPEKTEFFLSLSGTFLLSATIVVLLSFPVCLVLAI